MKFSILIISSFFIFQNNWELFTDIDGRFQITTPQNLLEKTDSVETAIGTIAYHTFYCNTLDGENELYTLSYCDYPKNTFHPDSLDLIEDFFAATIQSAALNLEGEVLYQADIQLNIHPGMYWRIDYNDGNAILKTKAYLVDNRLYSLQVYSLKEKNINLESDRFFDSFKLLE